MSEALRIIHVPRRFALDEWGGTESVVYHLCDEQARAGFKPEIHTSQALAKTSQEIWRNIPIHRYRHCYPFFGLSNEDILSLDKKGGNLLSIALYRSLRGMRDVRLFHAHVTKRMGGSVMVAAHKRKCPFVVTLHGNIFDVPKLEAASIVEAQQGHFEWGKPFGAFFRSRHVLDEADAVVCVGWSEYQKASKALGAERVHHLPNGVNPDLFGGGDGSIVRSRLGIDQDTFVFGCISRIDPQKNQLLLVSALAKLVADGIKVAVILAGPVTNPDYLEQIELAVAKANLQNSFRILPAVEVESEEHRSTLAALDCFVLPSRHEPFGIVILEAWAAGVPVVASNVGGLSRLICNEQNGLHFRDGNTEDLVEKISFLMKNSELCNSLIENGNIEVRSNYCWSAIAEKQEIIYQDAEKQLLNRSS
ncbi:glycosyltransferase family 4 protein [Rubellicoccus peritrichatus]|uniref:Glycosyltransferase family 4 protein n=1 Tax=Rubellicoccus peritrichatus TaxID=3080537 RepID=A0AAQ3LAA7_9BACT|nr:glycosyltransferase family 4 protein [Puniceicoccus sp. CR14]WOO42006.1 glycosyltransferase family 4 protein [Puniceicoccus sp. CR14]